MVRGEPFLWCHELKPRDANSCSSAAHYDCLSTSMPVRAHSTVVEALLSTLLNLLRAAPLLGFIPHYDTLYLITSRQPWLGGTGVVFLPALIVFRETTFTHLHIWIIWSRFSPNKQQSVLNFWDQTGLG